MCMVDPNGLRHVLRSNPSWARLATFKEVPIIAELLEPTDFILGAGFGLYEEHYGIVVVTERRVLFGGRKAASLFKHTKTEIFEFGKITSVQVNGSSLLSTLIIVTSGAKGEIKSMSTPDCRQIADVIRSKLASYAPLPPTQALQPPIPFQPLTQAASTVADDLDRLAKMRTDGLLTDLEYAAAKSKLLGI